MGTYFITFWGKHAAKSQITCMRVHVTLSFTPICSVKCTCNILAGATFLFISDDYLEYLSCIYIYIYVRYQVFFITCYEISRTGMDYTVIDVQMTSTFIQNCHFKLYPGISWQSSIYFVHSLPKICLVNYLYLFTVYKHMDSVVSGLFSNNLHLYSEMFLNFTMSFGKAPNFLLLTTEFIRMWENTSRTQR